MHTLQDLAGATDKASVFFIKCERPDDTDTVMEELRELLPRYEIRPLKDFISLMTSSNLPGLQAFINTMIGIAVAIGFLVIFLFDVHDHHRAHAGDRRAEVAGGVEGVHRAGDFERIDAALRGRDFAGHRVFIRLARAILEIVPDADDLDHRGLDF